MKFMREGPRDRAGGPTWHALGCSIHGFRWKSRDTGAAAPREWVMRRPGAAAGRDGAAPQRWRGGTLDIRRIPSDQGRLAAQLHHYEE
jgi:hypothetical protein